MLNSRTPLGIANQGQLQSSKPREPWDTRSRLKHPSPTNLPASLPRQADSPNRSTFIAWFCVAWVVCISSASGADAARRLEAARALIEAKWDKLSSPGVSVAIGVDGKVAWTAGQGLADIDRKRPATAETIYRYASISKPIAATALMQITEQGKVNIDSPIQTYVPSFPEKPEGVMTVRHLLTHTSGIRHYKGLEMFSNKRYASVEEALGIFKDDPLQFAPGAKYQYSSYGYNIIAAIVEHSSGESFRAYLKSHVFKPAGMTAADLELLEEPNPDRCVQYVFMETNNSFVPAKKVDLSYKWAGGGICGTAEDLVKFCIALDNGRLLKGATLSEMHQPMKLTDGSQSKYGLGWMLLADSKRRKWTAHSGGATGGTTYLLHNSDHKVSIAILCNTQSVKGLGELAMKAGEALLEE